MEVPRGAAARGALGAGRAACGACGCSWGGGLRWTPPQQQTPALDGSTSMTGCASQGTPRVFVTGDLARVIDDGRELPMLSPPAIQEGRWR